MKIRTILLGTIAGIFLVSVASSAEVGALGSGGCGSSHVTVAMGAYNPNLNAWF